MTKKELKEVEQLLKDMDTTDEDIEVLISIYRWMQRKYQEQKHKLKKHKRDEHNFE